MISTRTLQQWLEAGEHDQQDFKETISSSLKIAKTICSFANTRGGRILVGVRDNKAIRGVQVDEEKHMLDTAASFFCKPEIAISYDTCDIQGKQVLIVTVPVAQSKPVFARGDDHQWWAYIRVADKSVLASKLVMDVLKKETSGENALIQFSSKEKGLMEYLQKNERIQLKQFCKLVNISPWRARKILVNLITAGVIRVHTTEKVEFYTLS